MSTVDLTKYGIKVTNVLRNAEPAILYEQALKRGEGEIVRSGALAARSGFNADNPFTPAELERVLRQFDPDASLLQERKQF